ncbi:MAG: hypothetical protein FD146_2251 [Anaerolineaceae bacterium]|nr:MAG: hypothetical protein FD146_2251 [Anaerolineaceae bacterium]
MKKVLRAGTIIAICAILLFVGAACGGGDSAATDEPQAPAQPGGSGGQDPGGGQVPAGNANILFQNSSEFSLCEIYMTLSTRPEWNQSLVTQELQPGDEFTITEIPPGTYDIKVLDCDGYIIAWKIGEKVETDSKFTYNIGTPVDYLEIKNSSSKAICSLYVRPGNMSQYSRNMLNKQQRIPVGETFFFVLERGEWDFKFEACGGGGKVIEIENYPIQGETTLTITDN